MWAAIKSDFKEFVSTAAEETNAVTTKVVSKTSDSISGSGSKAKPEDQDNPNAGGWAGAALAPLSSASRGFSMEGVGASVKGFSSMIGGVVAPHPRPNASSAVVGEGDKNAALLASEEEEEELGWDDDEDDLDVDDDAEEGDAPLADVVLETEPSKQEVVTQDDQTNDIILALQSKLSAVEKERNELQIEHRKQTALLVELRSKVEELERENDAHVEGVTEKAKEEDSEMEALKDEIESLKLQLEQSGSSHVQVKDTENGEDNEILLEQYQRQIQELTNELETLQQKCHASDTELQRVKEQSSQGEQELNTLIDEQQKQLETVHSHTSQLEQSLVDMETAYARAQQELQDAKSKIVELEGENQRLAEEIEVQALNFASTLEEEVEKTKKEIHSMSFAAPVAIPAIPMTGARNEGEKLEDDGEISSGEKITADESFITAGDVLTPKVKRSGEAEAEEDDWGDGDWGDDDD
eukprot:CCRYP_004052-RA/>CCRYP_004052-RA protein AED:0.10 eAED:0.10 QI:0/-1/0/1/-1/1/1/0/468